MEDGYKIFLTKEEFREIRNNYSQRSDDSYRLHTAELIFDKLRENYPEEFEDINL